MLLPGRRRQNPFGPLKDAEGLRRELIHKAEFNLREYPQYRGHFNDYALCRVPQAVRTKMGLAFSPGEVTICKRHVEPPHPQSGGIPGQREVVAFSFKNNVDTVLDWMSVEDWPRIRGPR